MNLQLAVICDFRQEGWPSMDLAAEMLLRKSVERSAELPGRVTAIRPPFRKRLSKLPASGHVRTLQNADRLLNRMVHYPRHLRRCVAGRFDCYHLVDHSYSHLVHELPAEQVGVFCHDLDTFRCVLQPKLEPRPLWFRAMSRRILSGMQKAAVVFYTTAFVRERIMQAGILDASRLVRAPLAAAPEFSPRQVDPEPGPALLPTALQERPYLLHVGSCIPRKRVDVLLEAFAAARNDDPELHLVKVGGEWTSAHHHQLNRLGITTHVTRLSGLTREQLASLYRKARLVLQPSEAEGFGLPILEAVACGAMVLASDIPVFREVGGPAVVYCAVGNVEAWASMILRLLRQPAAAPTAVSRRVWAANYSWEFHTKIIWSAYAGLVGSSRRSDESIGVNVE